MQQSETCPDRPKFKRGRAFVVTRSACVNMIQVIFFPGGHVDVLVVLGKTVLRQLHLKTICLFCHLNAEVLRHFLWCIFLNLHVEECNLPLPLPGPALQKQADEGDVPRGLWNPPCRHAAVRPQPDGEHVLQRPRQGAGLHSHSGLGSEPAGPRSYHQGTII